VKKSSKTYQPPGLFSFPSRSLDPERADRLCQLAQAHLDSNLPETAADIMLRAIVFDSPNKKLHYMLCLALYKSGQFKSAISWLKKLSGKGYTNFDLLEGKILQDLNKASSALIAIDNALASNPNQIEALLTRADLYLSVGKLEKAIEDLDSILLFEPNNSKALALRARSYLDTANPHQALRDLEKKRRCR